MKNLNYGKDYKYAHSYSGNFIQADFLPDELQGIIMYEPGNNSSEIKILEQLLNNWKGKYDYKK